MVSLNTHWQFPEKPTTNWCNYCNAKLTMPRKMEQGLKAMMFILRPSDAYMRHYTDIISSDNCLLPGRHQAIIWTNDGLLSIGPLATNFSEISIEILTFSCKKMRLKVSSAKWRSFWLGLNVLTQERPTFVSHTCGIKWISIWIQQLIHPHHQANQMKIMWFHTSLLRTLYMLLLLCIGISWSRAALVKLMKNIL